MPKEPDLLDKTIQNFKNLMSKRYDELVDKLNNEVNIANRYDIKLRIEELTTMYSIIFGGK